MEHNFSHIFADSLKLLDRAVRGDLFRLIVLQYNHYSIVTDLRRYLTKKYPEKQVSLLNLREENPQSFLQKIRDLKTGIILLNGFEHLLSDHTFTVFFNQRRDYLTEFPIQLITLIPSGGKVLYEMMEKMPDMWSLRSMILEFEKETAPMQKLAMTPASSSVSSLGGYNASSKKAEIKSLRKRIDALPKIKEYRNLIYILLKQIQVIYEDLGDYESGLETVKEWEESNESLGGDDNIEILDRKANFIKKIGNFEKALKVINSALDLAKGQSNKGLISRLETHKAVILSRLGRYEEAKKLSEKALKFAVDFYGENHPNTAVCYSNLAFILTETEEYEAAKLLLEKALSTDLKNYDTTHLTTAVTYSNLSMVLCRLNDFASAKNYAEKALKINLEYYGKNHPSTALGYSNLAVVYFHLGLINEAVIAKKEAVNIRKKVLAPAHPYNAQDAIDLEILQAELVKQNEKTN